MLWYVALSVSLLMAFALQMQAQQFTSWGRPCTDIVKYNMLHQENLGAGLTMIECGVIPGGSGEFTGSDTIGDAPTPPNVLVSNRSCSSGSSCTRSESMVWHSGRPGDNTLVVNYNDHNGNNYSGTSYSTDGGTTFTQIIPAPFATGHGTNFGDPIVVFNTKLNKWFAGDLVTGCGGQGIGLWTSNDGITWTTGACAHNGGGDDRESMWVDNNPNSRTYGRMFISWNNFSLGGNLQVVYSDDGTTWTTKTLSNGFIRDVQLTGTPPPLPGPNFQFRSTVFVATMDEGAGGLSTRQNVMYRSVDGGNTWTSVIMGPRFNPVGDGVCADNSYFAKVNPIWRHMGWGQPAAGQNGVVHYAYAGQGQAANDKGDIYYQRSADNGLTWSTPIKLNDDTGGQFKTQWMPSVNVNYSSASFHQPLDVTVSWYDRRQATTACNVVSDVGCSYYRYGVQSTDNGATWQPNIQISDQLIPEPAQNDPGVQPCYAGDYDYSTALGSTAFVTWTDGRVSVGGVQVQSVEYAGVPEP